MPYYAGVDVGENRANAVLLLSDDGPSRRLELVDRYEGNPAGVVEFCRPASRVAVDAPGGLSAGAHLKDMTVAPKFRSGRCSEIPVPGTPAVPWVTPMRLGDCPGWMRTGFEIWFGLRASGAMVAETFPAAAFYLLNGNRWPPKKTTSTGRSARLRLLARLIEFSLSRTQGCSHDYIDAVACGAIVALGEPRHHTCSNPDGSVIWELKASAYRVGQREPQHFFPSS